jgi:hypothetical protein
MQRYFLQKIILEWHLYFFYIKGLTCRHLTLPNNICFFFFSVSPGGATYACSSGRCYVRREVLVTSYYAIQNRYQIKFCRFFKKLLPLTASTIVSRKWFSFECVCLLVLKQRTYLHICLHLYLNSSRLWVFKWHICLGTTYFQNKIHHTQMVFLLFRFMSVKIILCQASV